MNILMISCAKATELIEKRNASGLSAMEKVKLRIHTAMCDACRRYRGQSEFIDAILENKLRQPVGKVEVTEEMAKSLAESIRNKLK